MAVTADAHPGTPGGTPGDVLTAESVVHRPPPHLRPFVHSAVGYRYEGFPPGIHRGLPSRHLSVVISLVGPIETTAPRDRSHSLVALASGLHAAPVTIHHDGTQHGIHLHFTPRGARRLFGMPASELAWEVVPLTDVLGVGDGLIGRLREAGSWDERFAVLDAALTRALDTAARVPEPRAEVAFAFERLVHTAGAVDVGSLAREVGWSRRHLAQQFRTEYGLAPKVVARVLRFERARSLLVRPHRPRLADVATVCGYADQAHLTRDFSEFAGASPLAWLAEEEFPFVQDADDGLSSK